MKLMKHMIISQLGHQFGVRVEGNMQGLLRRGVHQTNLDTVRGLLEIFVEDR